jgi:dTDP-4-dehydrorhamnose reductase
MRVLVCGANGMLGHRVVAVARERGHEVRGTDLPELDLTDASATSRFVAEYAPDVAINCAAFTDVDKAEAEEELALRINRDTAANLAAAAPYVVHVSTDYVFDGEARDRPYVESDATAPRTAYGRTKLAGEEAVLGASDRHAVVRTAWLFGRGGKNFVDTMLQLGAERDELSVVFDQVGSPTWTGHLAPALVELAERRGAGLFHGTNAGECSWHQLAIEALSKAGHDVRVVAVTTEEFPRPAPRPAYSVLGTEREDGLRLPPWQEAVADHLKERVRT